MKRGESLNDRAALCGKEEGLGAHGKSSQTFGQQVLAGTAQLRGAAA
jgi:hypothetical protein